MKLVGWLKEYWMRGWMQLAGRGPLGRFATRMATWIAPPFYKRNWLATMNRHGYIAPTAAIDHSSLITGAYVYIGEHVKIIEETGGGHIEIGDQVRLHWDITLHTGQGGTITFGPRSSVQPGSQFVAYVGSIRIGADVHIGSNCAFYPYNHGFAPGMLIVDQPTTSKGDIILEDDVNLGVGVIVLEGVTIGKGAVVGAGSVVVQDIPPGAIAMGVPARVLRMRSEIERIDRENGTQQLAEEPLSPPQPAPIS